MRFADDGVGFPVAEAGFFFDHRRALVNAFAVRDLPAPVAAAVTFAAFFAAAEVGVEVAARSFIGIDVLINALRGNAGKVVCFAVAGDLSGRPLQAQQRFDLLPGFGFDAGGILFGLAALLGFVVGLFGTIAAVAAIAPQFAGDGRFINRKFTSNLRLRKAGF